MPGTHNKEIAMQHEDSTTDTKPLEQVNSQDAITASLTSKCGFLKKEGEIFKSWKKRWFEIHSIANNPNAFTLAYYKKKGDPKPIKEVILTKETVVMEAPDKETPSRNYCFKVATKERMLYLHCTSEEERKEWISALRNIISTCNAISKKK